jgi:hypothetical protein
LQGFFFKLCVMETQFDLVLSLKTPKGFIDYGWYPLGSNPEFAYQIFSQMKGCEKLADGAVLHLDLVETKERLPDKIKSLSCSLEELCENVKLISREMFRLKNLEEML